MPLKTYYHKLQLLLMVQSDYIGALKNQNENLSENERRKQLKDTITLVSQEIMCTSTHDRHNQKLQLLWGEGKNEGEKRE